MHSPLPKGEGQRVVKRGLFLPLASRVYPRKTPFRRSSKRTFIINMVVVMLTVPCNVVLRVKVLY